MKACQLILPLLIGLLVIPFFAAAQNDLYPAAYTYNDQGNTISSNVPLNAISTRAWRNFHQRFRVEDGTENWFASNDGYQVGFTVKGVHYQASFDLRGSYRYSLHYYAGKEIPRDPGDLLQRKYPDLKPNIVTEITDGEKTVYLVRMVGLSGIKIVSVCDGEIKVIQEG